MKKKLNNLWKSFKAFIKHLNKTISYVHKHSNMLYIAIFFDILFSFVCFGSSLDEYRLFEFYKINYKKRKTYLTEVKYEFLRDKLINKKILGMLKNKEKLLLRFKEEMKSEVFNTKNMSFKESETLIISNKELIARSENTRFASTAKLFNVSNYRSPAFMLDAINKEKLFFVEKSIQQHKLLRNITDSLVSINAIVVNRHSNNNVIALTITFKDNNKIVKGFVDIKTKKIKGHLRYEDGSIYNEKINNYEIPCVDEVISLTKKLAKELEEYGLLEFDYCITNHSSIYFMDVNVWTDYIFIQIPEYLNNRISINEKLK